MSEEKLITKKEVTQLESGELGVSPHLVRRLVASYRRAITRIELDEEGIRNARMLSMREDIYAMLGIVLKNLDPFLAEYNRANFCDQCGAPLEEKP